MASVSLYEVASISRLLKIIDLFCRIWYFYRALLQKRHIILRSLLIVATPYLAIPHTLQPTVVSVHRWEFEVWGVG